MDPSDLQSWPCMFTWTEILEDLPVLGSAAGLLALLRRLSGADDGMGYPSFRSPQWP